MALTGTFTNLLMTAKRRAQLSGRPLTSRETAGIAEGYASTAADRLYKAKSLELKEKEFDAELKAAKEAKERDRRGTIGAAAGAGAGFIVAGPPGAFVGAMIGEQLGGTWLCTEVHDKIGLTKEQLDTLTSFRAYAKEHHPGWLEFYIRVGPEIVNAIGEKYGAKVDSFYARLKTDMIEPVIDLFNEGMKETAYNVYRTNVISFIIQFTPHHAEEAEAVDKVDRGLKEAA